eukprot:3438368-Ditylum_brightwellii.AAC.1
MAARRSGRGARSEKHDDLFFLLEFSTEGNNVISRVLLGDGRFTGGVSLEPNLEASVLGFCHVGKLGELQDLAFGSNGGFIPVSYTHLTLPTN